MIQRKLSRRSRIASSVVGLTVILVMSAVMLSVVRRWQAEPHLVRLVAVVGVGGVLALGALLIDTARRGFFDRRRDNEMFTAIAFLMMGGLGLGLVDQGLGDGDMRDLFAGSVLLALCGMFFVMHLLEQQHLTTIEKLDALERRLDARASEG